MAKKTKPLPWIKLDNDASPPFNEELLIGFAGSPFAWQQVTLHEVRVNYGGKVFMFVSTDGNESLYQTATHYMLITPPEQ